MSRRGVMKMGSGMGEFSVVTVVAAWALASADIIAG